MFNWRYYDDLNSLISINAKNAGLKPFSIEELDLNNPLTNNIKNVNIEKKKGFFSVERWKELKNNSNSVVYNNSIEFEKDEKFVENTNSYLYKTVSTITEYSPLKYLYEYGIIGKALYFFVILALIFMLKTSIMFIGRLVYKIYSTLVTNSVSYYELIGFTTSFFIVLIFAFFSAYVPDDAAELTVVFVVLFVAGSILFFFYNVGLLAAFYIFSSVSSKEPVKKQTINDLVNFGLGLIRVIVCAIRYIIYDLQVDHLDLILHYTDEIDSSFVDNKNAILVFFSYFTSVMFDIITTIFLILITILKIALASFLMMLILDLFLLKKLILKSEDWLITQIRNQYKSLIKNL